MLCITAGGTVRYCGGGLGQVTGHAGGDDWCRRGLLPVSRLPLPRHLHRVWRPQQRGNQEAGSRGVVPGVQRL